MQNVKLATNELGEEKVSLAAKSQYQLIQTRMSLTAVKRIRWAAPSLSGPSVLLDLCKPCRNKQWENDEKKCTFSTVLFNVPFTLWVCFNGGSPSACGARVTEDVSGWEMAPLQVGGQYCTHLLQGRAWIHSSQADRNKGNKITFLVKHSYKLPWLPFSWFRFSYITLYILSIYPASFSQPWPDEPSDGALGKENDSHHNRDSIRSGSQLCQHAVCFAAKWNLTLH